MKNENKICPVCVHHTMLCDFWGLSASALTGHLPSCEHYDQKAHEKALTTLVKQLVVAIESDAQSTDGISDAMIGPYTDLKHILLQPLKIIDDDVCDDASNRTSKFDIPA